MICRIVICLAIFSTVSSIPLHLLGGRGGPLMQCKVSSGEEETKISFGSLVFYSCEPGLTLIGSDISTCKFFGKLLPGPPSCVDEEENIFAPNSIIFRRGSSPAKPKKFVAKLNAVENNENKSTSDTTSISHQPVSIELKMLKKSSALA